MILILARLLSPTVFLDHIVAADEMNLPDAPIVLGRVRRTNHFDWLLRIKLKCLLEVVVAAFFGEDG